MGPGGVVGAIVVVCAGGVLGAGGVVRAAGVLGARGSRADSFLWGAGRRDNDVSVSGRLHVSLLPSCGWGGGGAFQGFVRENH